MGLVAPCAVLMVRVLVDRRASLMCAGVGGDGAQRGFGVVNGLYRDVDSKVAELRQSTFAAVFVERCLDARDLLRALVDGTADTAVSEEL